MKKPITTHRLICALCLQTACYYSPEKSERKVSESIKNILCKECEEKNLITF